MSYKNIAIKNKNGDTYHPETHVDNIIGIEDLLKEIKDEILNVANVFHDKEEASIKEEMSPSKFKPGTTLCNHENKNDFPSINEHGVSYTLVGNNSNYIQVFITKEGDIWSRRSSVNDNWSGSWYNSKIEIEKKLDEKLFNNTMTAFGQVLNSKANKEEVEILKQSGVKINKDLVDALNSKNVLASTSDSISTNVDKVSLIKEPLGNALPKDVLEGVTFSNNKDVNLKGTIKIRSNQIIPIRYKSERIVLNDIYCDNLEVRPEIENLLPENIPEGIRIGGVKGTRNIEAISSSFSMVISRPGQKVFAPQPPYGKKWTGYIICSGLDFFELYDLSSKNKIYSHGQDYIDVIENEDDRQISVSVLNKPIRPNTKVIFALVYY